MICNYRNCKNEFEGRPNKKFCNRRCKSNEKTYRDRADAKMWRKSLEPYVIDRSCGYSEILGNVPEEFKK